MAEPAPATAAAGTGALPPLPRSAARLSTCVDFPGYLQLLQSSGARFTLLRNQPQLSPSLRNHHHPDLNPTGDRSSEVCLNADLAGSSALLPGYSRGSQGALRQARSDGLIGERRAQRGSVDGAAGAELLSSWDLSQCLNSTPRAPQSAAEIAAAVAPAAATAAAGGGGDGGSGRDTAAACCDAGEEDLQPSFATAMEVTAMAALPPTPTLTQQQLLLPLPPPAAVAPQLPAPRQAEWRFDSDLRRARAQALAASAASLDHIRYHRAAEQAGCRNSSGGDGVGGQGRGRGGGGVSGYVGGRHRPRTGRMQSAAVAVWGSFANLTAWTLCAARALRPEPTRDEPATAPGGPQQPCTIVRRSCSDPGAPDARRHLSVIKSSDSRVDGGAAITFGAAVSPVPLASGMAVARSPSAPVFVGPSGHLDALADLEVLVAAGAATSLSSSMLGPVLPPAASAADGSGGGGGAPAVGGSTGHAAPAPDGAHSEQQRQPRASLLRLCAEAMPWLRCGQRQISNVGRASLGYDRPPASYCTVRNACTAASAFVDLECLADQLAVGAGSSLEADGRCGASAALPASAETYRVRSTPNCQSCYHPQVQVGSAPQRLLPSPTAARVTATATVTDPRASRARTMIRRARSLRLDIIWPSAVSYERPRTSSV